MIATLACSVDRNLTLILSIIYALRSVETGRSSSWNAMMATVLTMMDVRGIAALSKDTPVPVVHPIRPITVSSFNQDKLPSA